MTDLIDREALKVLLWTKRPKDDASSVGTREFRLFCDGMCDMLDAAPRIVCRSCKHLFTGGDASEGHWHECGRRGCPAYLESVDPDRFGCVCWEASDD